MKTSDNKHSCKSKLRKGMVSRWAFDQFSSTVWTPQWRCLTGWRQTVLWAHQLPYTGCAHRHFSTTEKQASFSVLHYSYSKIHIIITESHTHTVINCGWTKWQHAQYRPSAAHNVLWSCHCLRWNLSVAIWFIRSEFQLLHSSKNIRRCRAAEERKVVKVGMIT